MRRVTRFDDGGLSSPVRLENGWVRADAYICRSGLLEYVRTDGSKWVEYRPPEESFTPELLASFASVPLTVGHPKEAKLTAANTKQYQVGTVEAPRQDGDNVRASLLVTDAEAIAELDAGNTNLSCGYECDLDFEPGEFEGKRYDAVQRRIRGNHVAIVPRGRAGPSIRVRMDSADLEVLQPTQPKEKLLKVTIEGKEYEVSEDLAAAIAALEAKAIEASKMVEDSKAVAQKQEARADAFGVEIKALKAELAEAPAKAMAAAKARADLEATAFRLAPEFKTDGLSDLEIKAGIAHSAFQIETKDKPNEYVNALFDLAVKNGPKALTTARVDEASLDSDPVASARRKFMEASRNQHKGA